MPFTKKLVVASAAAVSLVVSASADVINFSAAGSDDALTNVGAAGLIVAGVVILVWVFRKSLTIFGR